MTVVSGATLFDQLRTEVLNRLMPSLRHKMLGKLQPITLLSHVLSRKLHAGSADQSYVQTQVDEIKLNAKILTAATQNLFSWVALDFPLQLPADALFGECVELLKMECYSNQLMIDNHVTSSQMLPALEARILICAVILVLADKQGEKKKLDIRMQGDTIQFAWNQACATSASKNTGLLRNWYWVNQLSQDPLSQDPLSNNYQVEHNDAGLQLRFVTPP